uniref:Uncharacterized protein n=1 Tax=Rhizophagus irregularis (strain DAOM 181602 / DAOM 197198 / MUCL 43194) TaxID=747089 RepID=U9TDN5_RHIID
MSLIIEEEVRKKLKKLGPINHNDFLCQIYPEESLFDDILRRIKNMGPVVDRNEVMRCEYISTILYTAVSLLKDLLILPQMTVTGAESSGRDLIYRASFGPKDSKAPRYCATHKPIGHVNVKTQCQEDGCYKFPHLGFSSSKATSCVTHMKDGMIHLRVRKCLEPGCTTRAVFNVVGLDKGKFCAKRAKHKKPEMIDIQTKIYCKKPATHGLSNPIRCEKHSTDNMVDLVQKICSNCGLLDILLQDQKCADCSTYTKAKARARLAKQLRVKYILDVNNILYEAYDSIVEDCVCSKKRSDFVIDADTHKVVLEVDEYQHKKGEYNCEVKRM